MTAEEFMAMSVSQGFMAKVLGLTQGRISQLLDEGILVRDAESGQPRLFEGIKNYYLSKNAAGSGVNFWTEKALHEKAKRELAELKVAQRKGELYEAQIVEQVLSEIFTDCRSKLLGIGHKLAKRLEGRTAAQICDIIDEEINDCLKELSENVEEAQYESADAVEG